MDGDYSRLIADAAVFLKTSYPLGSQILTRHEFTLSKETIPEAVPASPLRAFEKPLSPPVKVEEPPAFSPEPVYPKWAETLSRPGITLNHSESVPPDARAQMRAHLWKLRAQLAPQVALFFNEEERFFLEKVVKALVARGIEAVLLEGNTYEKEGLWDIFFGIDMIKRIIIPYGVHLKPHLAPHFTAFPGKNLCYLGKIPAIVLQPLSVYAENLQAKKDLWHALCRPCT